MATRERHGTEGGERSSTALRQPHGIDFLDDDTLLVADRVGTVAAFRLPPTGDEGEMTPIAPVKAACHARSTCRA